MQGSVTKEGLSVNVSPVPSLSFSVSLSLSFSLLLSHLCCLSVAILALYYRTCRKLA